MLVTPLKIVVGNTLSADANHVTNDAARTYGSLWKTKKVNGLITSCKKRVHVGSTRNATFVICEWNLPGRVVLKELSSRLVAHVPNAEPEEIGEIVPPGDEDTIDENGSSDSSLTFFKSLLSCLLLRHNLLRHVHHLLCLLLLVLLLKNNTRPA